MRARTAATVVSSSCAGRKNRTGRWSVMVRQPFHIEPSEANFHLVRRLLPIVGLLLVGLGVLPGCSSDGDRLVVYSGRSEDLIGPILDRFSEEQDVGIDVRYGDSADLA